MCSRRLGRREYEVQKANRKTRVKDRFGRLAGLALALTDDPQSTRAWATGAKVSIMR